MERILVASSQQQERFTSGDRIYKEEGAFPKNSPYQYPLVLLLYPNFLSTLLPTIERLFVLTLPRLTAQPIHFVPIFFDWQMGVVHFDTLLQHCLLAIYG